MAMVKICLTASSHRPRDLMNIVKISSGAGGSENNKDQKNQKESPAFLF